MFQNVLAFVNKLLNKAGERNRQHPPLKDQPDEQGFNPTNGRLIEDHWETFPKLGSAGQSHVQRNQDFGSKKRITQEPVEPLLSFFWPDLQGQTSG